MSTLAEIEAAVPNLSAEELAKLERFVRLQRRKQQPRPVARRTPKTMGALSLSREPRDEWRAAIAQRNWRA